VDYRSDPIVAVIQGEEGDHFIAEFFNRICRSLPPAMRFLVSPWREQAFRDDFERARE
jgi:hypothetical protein